MSKYRYIQAYSFLEQIIYFFSHCTLSEEYIELHATFTLLFAKTASIKTYATVMAYNQSDCSLCGLLIYCCILTQVIPLKC